MAELSEVEARLSAMFRVAGSQVPDEPVMGPARALGLLGPKDDVAEVVGDGPGGRGRLPRRWRRPAMGAGAVLAFLVIGGGVAAATV